MKIELKRISVSERMSEETNCFVADLYINGKKVGECKNDGRGGCTDYHANTLENRKVIEMAEAFCSKLPKVKYHDTEFDQSLESVIDDLVEAHRKEKDLKRIQNKMHKAYLSAICYGKKTANGYEYATTFWRGRTLAQIPLPILQKEYDNVVAHKMQKGDVILNDNLEALGVKL
jgi:hypothetical protein